MLKIILNRFQPQKRSLQKRKQVPEPEGAPQKKIFNFRILCEKYLQNQQNLYHVFIDFKKAFDRVWHEALWATTRKDNINASIIRAIEYLYGKAKSAALFNGSTGEWFRTEVGVRQGCLLSPSKKISNDQELIQSDPISCPQNQMGNNLIHKLTAVYETHAR